MHLTLEFSFFIITLILIYLLTKSIVDPLKRITNTANEFATGNLIPQIDESLIAREDEIGKLSTAFKEMKTQISRIILQVKKGNREKCEELLRWAIDETNKELSLNRELDIDIQFGDNYAAIH